MVVTRLMQEQSHLNQPQTLPAESNGT